MVLEITRKESAMIKWFAFMAFICFCFFFTACAHIKGKATYKQESIQIQDIPDRVEGVDLVEITTESGYVVKVPRDMIPTNKDGVPYWEVVHVEPSENLESAGNAASAIPGGIGSIFATVIGIASLGINKYQRAKLQEEADRRQKAEEDVKIRDKLMIAASVGVELATTDGAIKKKIKGLMTKKQQAKFDDITEDARVVAKAAKEIASNN